MFSFAGLVSVTAERRQHRQHRGRAGSLRRLGVKNSETETIKLLNDRLHRPCERERDTERARERVRAERVVESGKDSGCGSGSAFRQRRGSEDFEPVNRKHLNLNANR